MTLTRYTDYALRVLMHLGVAGDEPVTIGAIAARYDISRHHVMKVVQGLSRAGYVRTVRGRNGGLRLARRPEEINVGRLVRETEERLDLVECLGQRGNCVVAPACVLRGALVEALGAFLAVLDGYTLADLLAPQAELRRLLRVA